MCQTEYTPIKSVLKAIPWASAFKADYNERTMPTPRNLSQELNSASPWLQSLDVSMSERYVAVRFGGETPHLSLPSQVPQLTFQSPGGDVMMRTAGASPAISPPRQRMRFN